MKIIVLGASGMLGNAVFRVLSEGTENEIFGTIRNTDVKRLFISKLKPNWSINPAGIRGISTSDTVKVRKQVLQILQMVSSTS